MVSWTRQVAVDVIRSSWILDILEDTAHRIPYRLDLEYESEKERYRRIPKFLASTIRGMKSSQFGIDY